MSKSVIKLAQARRKQAGRLFGEVPPEVTGDRVPKDQAGFSTREQRRSKKVNLTTFLNTPFKLLTISTSYQIVPANRARNYLIIQNKAAAGDFYIVFGNRSNTFAGIKVEAGGYYEPYICPNSSVNILCTVADMEGVIIEGIEG